MGDAGSGARASDRAADDNDRRGGDLAEPGDNTGMDGDERPAVDGPDTAETEEATTTTADGSAARDVPEDGERPRREVVVPDRLYKTVTVFSTLVAVASVVLGFSFLGAAGTVLENPPGSLFVGLIRSVTGLGLARLDPYLSALALVLGLIGLGLIAGGGWVYAMGSRFRTEGMRKAKNEADEPSNNG
jgi:hypothetical protein